MREDLHQEKKRLQQALARYTSDLQNQKEELTQGIRSYKETFSEKLKVSSDVLERGKWVAIGLGAVWFIYQLTNIIFGSGNSGHYLEEGDDSNTKIVVLQPKEDSSIIKMIKNGIATFLLNIAKKELTRVLEKLREGSTQSEEKQ